MIVCVNCGQVNETAASRCLRCGASIFEYPSYLGPAGTTPSGPVAGSPSPLPAPLPPAPPPPVPSPPPHGSPQGTSRPTMPSPAPMPMPPSSGVPAVPTAPPPLIQPVLVMGGFVCPYCRTTLPPRITHRTSPAGWFIFALLLIFCWPLFWIGFFFQEEVCRCRQCGRQLA